MANHRKHGSKKGKKRTKSKKVSHRKSAAAVRRGKAAFRKSAAKHGGVRKYKALLSRRAKARAKKRK